MKKIILMMLFIICIWAQKASAQKQGFSIVPLGVLGGGDEGNLSAYLLAPKDTDKYICLDAGTIYDGLKSARKRNVFKKPIEDFLRNNIIAYFISHPHLDHVAGLILNSPEDSKKEIYGLPFCLKTLKNNYFTWSSWANFANEGEQPALKKYKYHYLTNGKAEKVDRTDLEVTPYLLSHAVPGQSTAFLVRHDEDYFLYLGDTGDDLLEQSDYLNKLWTAVAPLVRSKKLLGISMECSYPDEQPDNKMYGHLKPSLFMKNLKILDSLAGKNSLDNMPVIVAHRKPVGDNLQTIQTELTKLNNLNLNLIFPVKGKKIEINERNYDKGR